MSNKIEIVYDVDRSEVLHDAIVGHSIVEVLADGVPVAEASGVRLCLTWDKEKLEQLEKEEGQ